MKEIRAYIQPFQLPRIMQALLEIDGFPGMSVSDCEGFGREKTAAGQDYSPFVQKKRIEIFTPDELAELIFETIMREAQTGQAGDGKVYMLEAQRGGRISSGERGRDLA
ncbi:MAG: P-II family nitrogen regulator [Methylotetracoccus sp.]